MGTCSLLYFLIFLCTMLKKKYFGVYKFPCWFPYVDDTFALVPTDFDLSYLLSIVYSIDPCIAFTPKVENENSLSFLGDLVLKHKSRF